jgi:two-component system nitrogen regulation response regulator NtrX
MAQDILIIDDEADIRNLIAGILQDEGFTTRQAAEGLQGIEMIRDRCPDLVILDIWLGDSRNDGIKILELIKQETPDLPVLMISGHGTVETAVAAIKRGAYDFVEKPFKAERLLILVRRAMEAAALKDEVIELKSRTTDNMEIIGISLFSSQLRQTIQRVANTNSRVLISGPTGSGKELVARSIHGVSRLGKGRMVVFNCSVAGEDQFDRELYGEEKNGERLFTGALELAHNGTLLLDEISEIPLSCQSKLVRMLHEQSFTRLGGTRKIHVNVRILAATSADCEQAISLGLMREDLYNRLNVVPIPMLPLVARLDDVAPLATHFLSQIAQFKGIVAPRFTEEVLTSLQGYAWPGNIRQLKNVMEWIVIMTQSANVDEITLDMLPSDIAHRLPSTVTADRANEILNLPLREAREIFEREYMLAQLSKFSGNVSQTAHFIGMERSALHRKLRLLSVVTPQCLPKGGKAS